MKFAILSLAATAALALSSGTASAQWGHDHGHGHHHHGHSVIHPGSHLHLGPHLDYHRGHYHYHDGFYRSGPLYPAYGIGYQFGGAPGLRMNPGVGYSSPWNGGYYGGPTRGSAFGGYRVGW